MYLQFEECVLTKVHAEQEGSPIVRYTPTGLTATRELSCAWEDAFDLACELQGYMEPGADPGQPVIWYMPHRFNHPYKNYEPEIDPPCLVDNVVVKGVAKNEEAEYSNPSETNNAAIKYEKAILTVDYITIPKGIDRFKILVAETLEPFTEFITLSNKKLFWNNDGVTDPLTLQESPGYMARGSEWVYKIKRFPFVPPGILGVDTETLVGKINSDSVYSYQFDKTFDPETLLLNSPELTDFVDHNGTQLWETGLHLCHRPEGWNTLYRKETEEWATAYHENGDPFLPYESAVFEDLFLYEAV